MATIAATAIEDFATSAGLHALAEATGANPLFAADSLLDFHDRGCCI